MSWQEILNNINQDFFNDRTEDELRKAVEFGWTDPDVVKNRWLGFPPASIEAIGAKETELNTELPPSYVQFLLYSNGFRDISPFLNNLFPIESISWATHFQIEQQLKVWEDQDNDVSDKKYNYYGPNQDPVWYRAKYIKHSVKICEWFDGMCVYLNPIIKFEKEWEVIEFATWLPGARRYKSFKEYMISVHERNIKLLQNKQ